MHGKWRWSNQHPCQTNIITLLTQAINACNSLSLSFLSISKHNVPAITVWLQLGEIFVIKMVYVNKICRTSCRRIFSVTFFAVCLHFTQTIRFWQLFSSATSTFKSDGNCFWKSFCILHRIQWLFKLNQSFFGMRFVLIYSLFADVFWHFSSVPMVLLNDECVQWLEMEWNNSGANFISNIKNPREPYFHHQTN